MAEKVEAITIELYIISDNYRCYTINEFFYIINSINIILLKQYVSKSDNNYKDT